MKKIYFLAFLTLFSFVAQAQVPNLGINYQVQIRSSNGVVMGDSTLSLRLTLFPNSTSSTILWQEVHSGRQTDRMGVVNVVLGNGNRTAGSAATFSAVDFGAGQLNVQSEVSFNGGNTWANLGSRTPLTSVPYAKYAENAVAIPSGMIMAFAGDTNRIPQGWMLCDGRELSRSDFADLYFAIGLAWGSGNGTSTFNIPDTRGYFLRGVNGNNGTNDPDASTRTALKAGGNIGNLVGSVQSDEFKSHNHTYIAYGQTLGTGQTSIPPQGNNPNPQYKSTSSAGGSETRPKNVYVHYIIKL